jgi:hypothetical protein
MAKNKMWTLEDDESLIRRLPRYTKSELAGMFGTTKASIEARVNTLKGKGHKVTDFVVEKKHHQAAIAILCNLAEELQCSPAKAFQILTGMDLKHLRLKDNDLAHSELGGG